MSISRYLKHLLPTLAVALLTPILVAADNDGYDDSFFAPPVEADEPAETQSDDPPMLGVQMTPPPRRIQEREGLGPDEGVYVFRTYDGTAADNLGIRPGDVITEVNGQPINSMQDLRDVVFDSGVGDDVTVEISRDGTRTTLGGATLETWPEHIEMQNIDSDAERRYRDNQMGRMARAFDEISETQDQIKDLERELTEGSKDMPGFNEARRRSDQVRNLLGRDPKILPMAMLALPDWKFDYQASAQPGQAGAQLGVEGESRDSVATELASMAPPLHLGYRINVVGGAL